MDLNSIGLPITFVILAAILLWFIIGSRGHWIIKAVCIAMTLYFSIAMWHSLEDLVGWPSSKDLPNKFLVHWIVVREPIKGTNDEGSIYIWAKELDANYRPKEEVKHPYLLPLVGKKGNNEPRVHEMPYSRDMHEKAQKALAQIKAGKAVVGGNEGELGGEGGKGKGKGKGRPGQGRPGEGDGQGDLSRRSDMITFYELPPSKLPRKIYPPSESIGGPPSLPGPSPSVGRPLPSEPPTNPFEP